jgi:hypothetical protein
MSASIFTAASKGSYQSASLRLDHIHRESCTSGSRLACEKFKLAGKVKSGFSVDPRPIAGQLRKLRADKIAWTSSRRRGRA